MKLELLEKLKALSESGVGGEKENARELLDKLLCEHGIDVTDFPDELKEYQFHYCDQWERSLLLQIMSKIAPNRQKYRYAAGPGSRSVICCVCTEAEKLQIEIEHEFYSRLWQEELDTFFYAFVLMHRLFDPSPNQTTGEVDPELIKRMRTMMAGMQDKEPPLLLQVENQN